MSDCFTVESVEHVGMALFVAAGANERAARAAVTALVTSSLMGHDSHGVLRIPEYLGFVADGSLLPNAEPSVERTGPTAAVGDCGGGFGAVGAERAMRLAIDLAHEQRTACVI